MQTSQQSVDCDKFTSRFAATEVSGHVKITVRKRYDWFYTTENKTFDPLQKIVLYIFFIYKARVFLQFLVSNFRKTFR